MLYMLGGLQIDTKRFSISGASRSSTAELVEKQIVAAAPAYEFMGPGASDFALTGQILPYHLGGLNELEVAHRMCSDGERFNVMRGDGVSLGHHCLTSVKEAHKEPSDQGVGFVVAHTLSLKKVQFSTEGAQSTVTSVLALFDALR
ncbi:MAG: phage tail protein [Pseudomonadota bacterium]